VSSPTQDMQLCQHGADSQEQQKARRAAAEPWEDRFPRYARNAETTARFSDEYAARQRRAAGLHANASANARRHGDETAADLYDEMSKAALDAADALADTAELARKVAEHYGSQVPARQEA
jgi:hypothetical protein